MGLNPGIICSEDLGAKVSKCIIHLAIGITLYCEAIQCKRVLLALYMHHRIFSLQYYSMFMCGLNTLIFIFLHDTLSMYCQILGTSNVIHPINLFLWLPFCCFTVCVSIDQCEMMSWKVAIQQLGSLYVEQANRQQVRI